MKNKKILIICNKTNINLYKYFFNYYNICVERGCLELINQNLKINLACGDFDSLNINEYKKVKKYSQKIIKFSSVKNLIDGEIAIKYAIQLCPKKIILIADGNRIDMTLATFGFIFNYNIIWLNNYNYCYLLKNKIKNIIFPKQGYRYLSLISNCDALINIDGLKYNVTKFTIWSLSGNAISNEFVKNQIATIIVLFGKVAIIYTK